MSPDGSAGRAGSVGGTVAGLGCVLLVATSPVAAAVGVLAAVALPASRRRGSRRLLSAGALGLFGCVLLAGVRGVATPSLLAATVLAVLAYDLSENAFGLSEQVGAATTTRVELVHGAGTAALAGSVATGAYTVASVAPSGLPSAAFLALLVGAVLLVVGLDR
jgi:hypothetical protein